MEVIIEYLKSHPESHARAISSAIAVEYPLVQGALKALLKSGDVKKNGRGLYSFRKKRNKTKKSNWRHISDLNSNAFGGSQ